MRVLTRPTLTAFWSKDQKAQKPLEDWYNALLKGTFPDFVSLKGSFDSVDRVLDPHDPLAWHIFDVGGNKYRVVTKISYTGQIAWIKYVFTHKEYDRWNKQGRP